MLIPIGTSFITGGHIGYRRTATGGTWNARFHPTNGKRVFETFGDLSDVDPVDQFNAVQQYALEWVTSLGIISERGYTVQSAVDDYVKHLKIHNSYSSALKTEQRLKLHIPKELARLKLNKLTLKMLNDWHHARVKNTNDPDAL